jgi:hypothetical protein
LYPLEADTDASSYTGMVLIIGGLSAGINSRRHDVVANLALQFEAGVAVEEDGEVLSINVVVPALTLVLYPLVN